MNTSEKANQLNKKYNLILEKYQSSRKQEQKPMTLYRVWWAKSIFTRGETNWFTEICKLAGGYVFVDLAQPSVQTERKKWYYKEFPMSFAWGYKKKRLIQR